MAEIGENCILGADFCLRTGMDKIFRSAILESSQEKKLKYLYCRRISSSSKGIPEGYKKLFERNSREMDDSQRGILQIFS